MKQYRTRKEQIDSFVGEIIKQCETEGIVLSRKVRARIRDNLRSAALAGACEERSRVCNLAKSDPFTTALRLYDNIVAVPIMKVLGYE